MEVMYRSTRGHGGEVTASQAILKGLSDDGGLFVPVQIPRLDISLEELSRMSYQEVAYEVMRRFLTDFTEEELKDCIARAYDSKFDTESYRTSGTGRRCVLSGIVPWGYHCFQRIWHFSILPHLMTKAARKNHADKEIVILTATSGDTGKSSYGRLCRCGGDQNHCFLSEEWCQSHSGKANGDSERKKIHMVGIWEFR